MRLWSFQALTSVEELRSKGKLIARWDRYPKASKWTKAYEWMAEEMGKKDISCEGYAPIWAWHSCGAFYQPPTLDTARNLLSDLEIEAGVQTIEFECPNHLALLSKYGPWNDVLYHFLNGLETPTIPTSHIKAMYELDPDNFEEYEAIQATLPYLCLDWVIEIRDLNLTAGDFEYPSDERV